MTLHDAKLALLPATEAASPKPLSKYNLIGRPSQRGELEFCLGVNFDSDERFLASKAFDELLSAGFIQPKYSDLAAPSDWAVITDAGKQALRRNTLDDLDEVLVRISPDLLEIRRGAWAALASARPDSARQAAHSARELIDQVLKVGAPDEEIRSQLNFRPDPSSSSGITRRMRLRVLMSKYRGETSESDLAVVEKAGELLLAIDTKLQAGSHDRSAPIEAEVRESLSIAELMLRRLLLAA